MVRDSQGTGEPSGCPARSHPVVVERPWVDPWRVFLSARSLPGRVLLDSGGEVGPSSRWTVLAMNPLETLEWRVPAPAALPEGGEPFERIEALHGRWAERLRGLRRGPGSTSAAGRERPEGRVGGAAGVFGLRGFTGGTIAAVGYDAARALENLPSLAKDDPKLPDVWAAVYDGAILFDRMRRRVFLVSWFPDERERQELREKSLRAVGGDRPASARRATAQSPEAGFLPSAGAPPIGARDSSEGPLSDDGREQFLEGVRKIQQEIGRGEIYQANLTRRIVRSASLGSGPRIYERLRGLSPTPFAAYVDAGAFHLLSASPERLLRITRSDGPSTEHPSGVVVAETRPIKGTRPRGATPVQDAAFRAQLLASAKDRAELLMIVDLERNDLGRVCRMGSIEVSELAAIEGYSTIWHLAATVRGRLDPGVSPMAALRALFPGGSISGAPKIRAMEILEGLETDRRKFAMGSLVSWDFSGEMDSSILIRTITLAGTHAVLRVGGGIVADSSPDAEFEETVVKAAPMLAALEDA